MTPVLFHVDAGPGVGLGHLQRSLALAAALRRSGATCVVASLDDREVRSRVSAGGCEFEPQTVFDGDAGAPEVEYTARLARRHGCGTVVVDSYRTPAAYLSGLRSAGLFVVAIDDLAREPLPAHVVVNGGAQASGLPYRSSSGDTVFLLGATYALLGPPFWDLSPRDISPSVARVLVSAGGDDPRGLLPRVVTALDGVPGDFEVHVVVGPFVATREDLQDAIRTARHAASIVDAPDGLCDLLAESDLLISGAGQTLYEAAATGTPSIAVEVFDNQAGSLGNLRAAGVVEHAGHINDPRIVERLTALARAVAADPDRRRRLSGAGRRLIDGRGALRVAPVILGSA